MSFGARLREERKKLKLNQPEFAAIADTTKQTLYSWETDKTTPPVGRLAQFAQAGVDVQYVLTGEQATVRQSLIAHHMLEASGDDKELQSLAIKAVEDIGKLAAKRKPFYTYLIELLNDCSDESVDQIIALVEKIRVADVQKDKQN